MLHFAALPGYLVVVDSTRSPGEPGVSAPSGHGLSRRSGGTILFVRSVLVFPGGGYEDLAIDLVRQGGCGPVP